MVECIGHGRGIFEDITDYGTQGALPLRARGKERDKDENVKASKMKSRILPKY